MTSHLRFFALWRRLDYYFWIETPAWIFREKGGKTIKICNINDKLADWSIENFALLPFSKEIAALGNEEVKIYILKIKMYKFTNKFWAGLHSINVSRTISERTSIFPEFRLLLWIRTDVWSFAQPLGFINFQARPIAMVGKHYNIRMHITTVNSSNNVPYLCTSSPV